MLNSEQKRKYLDLLMSYETNSNWLNNFYEYKNKLVPPKIYRYRTVNSYNLKALKHNYVWLNAPENFNDIYDCMLNIKSSVLLLHNRVNEIYKQDTSFVKNEIEVLLHAENQIKAGKMHVEEFVAYLNLEHNRILHKKLTSSQAFKSYQDIYDCLKNFNLNNEPTKKILVKCKLACFSETYDNILMWSHYAKYNKGFCIEYDINKCENIIKKLYPVLYFSEPIFCPKLIDDYVDGKVDISVSQTIFSTIKFEDWQYEKEWRLFGREQVIKMPTLPSCIYLGANIKPYNQRKLCKIADKLGIRVKKMQYHEGQFKLVAVDL